MKHSLLLLVLLSLAVSAPDAEARTYNLYGGIAKITLPKGAKLKDWSTYQGEPGYEVIFSTKDLANRVFIQRESVPESLSTPKWRSKRESYYMKLFKDKRYKKNSLKASKDHVTVDYQYKMSGDLNRDYTKYLRANKNTQVQAYFWTMNAKTWNQNKPKQLRAVVNSLRSGR